MSKNKQNWAEGIKVQTINSLTDRQTPRHLDLCILTTQISKSKANQTGLGEFWVQNIELTVPRTFETLACRPPNFHNSKQIRLGLGNLGSKILKVWQSLGHLNKIISTTQISYSKTSQIGLRECWVQNIENLTHSRTFEPKHIDHPNFNKLTRERTRW